ncbi:ATP-binding protein [Bacteroidales bacterium]
MSAHIRNLIAQGENQQLDFKFEISDSRKIARTLVAFANTDGGRLLIGLKDNGVVAGMRSEEEYYMLEAASNMYCRPEVKFQTREWTIDGKLVLEVIVPKSNGIKHKAPHHLDDYKVFVRVHDQNLLADPVLLEFWKREQDGNPVNIQFSDTEMTLLQLLNQTKGMSLDEFRMAAGISRKTATRKLVDFMLIGFARMIQTERESRYFLIPTEVIQKVIPKKM